MKASDKLRNKHSEKTHLQAEHLPPLERLESALDLDLVLVLAANGATTGAATTGAKGAGTTPGGTTGAGTGGSTAATMSAWAGMTGT